MSGLGSIGRHLCLLQSTWFCWHLLSNHSFSKTLSLREVLESTSLRLKPWFVEKGALLLLILEICLKLRS